MERERTISKRTWDVWEIQLFRNSLKSYSIMLCLSIFHGFIINISPYWALKQPAIWNCICNTPCSPNSSLKSYQLWQCQFLFLLSTAAKQEINVFLCTSSYTTLHYSQYLLLNNFVPHSTRLRRWFTGQ